MPANLNPQVRDLLSWHGHAAGGVHVPFQVRGNPIGRVIETGLVQRLRGLASDLARDAASTPRWVFLVGGPGNGKSETVQDFLQHLDSSLALDGRLVHALKTKYSHGPVLPRRVEILPGDMAGDAGAFTAKVGRLIVVQDATATETALGNAARELATDLADLLTTPATPPLPVFVACANRGLLARAMNEAARAYGEGNPATLVLTQVIQASSLGRETLTGRKACWPLEGDPRFGCWPIDIESLVVAPPPAVPPLEQMFVGAAALDRWEVADRCQDCSSRGLCPLRQNAEWLRQEDTRRNLLGMIRRGELARGQRWNFRDAYSLVAELIVGQWSDFPGCSHPCEWVHREGTAATRAQPAPASVVSLTSRLYPHALLRGGAVSDTASTFVDNANIDAGAKPLTAAVLAAIAATSDDSSTKPIREILTRDYARLDPATSTPADMAHPLRPVEEAFCQSIEQGRTAMQQHSPAPIEHVLLTLLEGAEGEWDVLGRDSKAAIEAVCILRKIGGMMAKRSAGVRLGKHALDDMLADYEACLRDRTRLAGIRDALKPLLGETGFQFNLVELLGQPRAEGQPLVSLNGPPSGVRALPAPGPLPTAPGHDVPCIEVTDLQYQIPLTFDFFLALRLRKAGCAGSSLPASVRAALDRLRHRYAGDLCRDENQFIDGRAFVTLGSGRQLGVPSPGAEPALT